MFQLITCVNLRYKSLRLPPVSNCDQSTSSQYFNYIGNPLGKSVKRNSCYINVPMFWNIFYEIACNCHHECCRDKCTKWYSNQNLFLIITGNDCTQRSWTFLARATRFFLKKPHLVTWGLVKALELCSETAQLNISDASFFMEIITLMRETFSSNVKPVLQQNILSATRIRRWSEASTSHLTYFKRNSCNQENKWKSMALNCWIYQNRCPFLQKTFRPSVCDSLLSEILSIQTVQL